jgi:hypothetical protein
LVFLCGIKEVYRSEVHEVGQWKLEKNEDGCRLCYCSYLMIIRSCCDCQQVSIIGTSCLLLFVCLYRLVLLLLLLLFFCCFFVVLLSLLSVGGGLGRKVARVHFAGRWALCVEIWGKYLVGRFGCSFLGVTQYDGDGDGDGEDDDNTKGKFSAAVTLFGWISSKEHQSSGVPSCHIIPAGHLLCCCRNKKPKREVTSSTALEVGRRGKQFGRNVTRGRNFVAC